MPWARAVGCCHPADRVPQLTGIVEEREMRAQYLDMMDIERERGITITSQAARTALPAAPRRFRDVRQWNPPAVQPRRGPAIRCHRQS
ncbi:hypothetical protein D9T14_04330 [Propionibacterium australiense]|uniref:Uncharacterized protein n=1 Tax=Propionibacterium australiense TaxID=119981 RepID=A0A8B3FTB3_9ACTN|nr:hypothetical protein D9T14_04330 [Propionibacterium australiense]RLP13056.1 hypothetical protein D7U36_01125 [Propionibacterium australiense]